MNESKLSNQNTALLKNISTLHIPMERALNTVNAQPTTIENKLFGIVSRKPKIQSASEEALRAAAEPGLQTWSNMLYFDFSGESGS